MSEARAGVVVAAVDDHPVVLRGLAQVFAESAADIRLSVVTTGPGGPARTGRERSACAGRSSSG